MGNKTSRKHSKKEQENNNNAPTAVQAPNNNVKPVEQLPGSNENTNDEEKRDIEPNTQGNQETDTVGPLINTNDNKNNLQQNATVYGVDGLVVTLTENNTIPMSEEIENNGGNNTTDNNNNGNQKQSELKKMDPIEVYSKTKDTWFPAIVSKVNRHKRKILCKIIDLESLQVAYKPLNMDSGHYRVRTYSTQVIFEFFYFFYFFFTCIHFSCWRCFVVSIERSMVHSYRINK